MKKDEIINFFLSSISPARLATKVSLFHRASCRRDVELVLERGGIEFPASTPTLLVTGEAKTKLNFFIFPRLKRHVREQSFCRERKSGINVEQSLPLFGALCARCQENLPENF